MSELFEEEKNISVTFFSDETKETFSCELLPLLKLSMFYKEYFDVYSPFQIQHVPKHISHVFGRVMEFVNRPNDGIKFLQNETLETTLELLKAADYLILNSLTDVCISHIVFNLYEDDNMLLPLRQSSVDDNNKKRIVVLLQKVTEFKTLETLVVKKEDRFPNPVIQHIAFLIYMTFAWNQNHAIEWPTDTKKWKQTSLQAREFGTLLIGADKIQKCIDDYMYPLVEDDIHVSENSYDAITIGAILDTLCRNGFIEGVRRFIIMEFDLTDIKYLQEVHKRV